MKRRHFSWVSLTLLLVSYAWFGWYLSGLEPWPPSLQAWCYQAFGEPIPASVRTQAGLSTAIEPTRSPTAPDVEQPQEVNQPEGHHASRQKQAHKVSRVVCGTIVRNNLPAGVLTIGWIIFSSLAFVSPMTSFNTFITRWFQSDMMAFLGMFIIVGLAVLILVWLRIILQILMILATDALARIDIQDLGMDGQQAFWILFTVSLVGLTLGWTAHALI